MLNKTCVQQYFITFSRDQAKESTKEVWRPEEVNQWGRVKESHPLPLYQYAIGPPCRAVHLTAVLLDINLNLLEVRPEINSFKDMRWVSKISTREAFPLGHLHPPPPKKTQFNTHTANYSPLKIKKSRCSGLKFFVTSLGGDYN